MDLYSTCSVAMLRKGECHERAGTNAENALKKVLETDVFEGRDTKKISFGTRTHGDFRGLKTRSEPQNVQNSEGFSYRSVSE